MKRPQNFDELLDIAKNRPDVHGALSQLGISLKRVGYAMGGERWQTETKGGTSGDLSAIAFIEKPDGKWIFYDNKGRFGKNSIDPIAFLREGFGITFDDAVYMLSGGAPSAPIANPKPLTLERKIEPQEKPTYTPPTPAPDKLRNVKAYLIQTRKLPKELVLPLIDSGRIYATYYENPETHKQTLVCAFKITDENGNDVGCDSCAPQPEFKFKHLFTGSNADYAWCFPYEVEEITSETPIFFCEAPIDTMSLCALSGTPGIYVSMAGLKDSTFTSVTEKLGGTPIICVDNDEAGDKFAARHSDVPRMVAPIGKDWNDTLKHYVENNISYAFAPPDAAAAPDVTHQDNVGGHVVRHESEERDPKKENGALDKGASREKYFINLSTDNELSKRLQGTYGSKKYKEIQQYIIDTLGKDPIIINNGLSVIIDNRDAQHIAHNAVGEKIAQIYHIKDLLTSATLFAEDKNVKHNKFDYFSYHEVYVKYKEDIYPVYFNIGKGISDKKHHVYDITKKIGDTANRINGLERPKPNEGYAQKNDISTYSISPTDEKINTSDEKNSKQLNDEDPPIADNNKKHSQDELRATLEAKVTDVVNNYRADPRALAEYVLFSSRFNNYSANNLRLIWSQYPYAQYVTSAYDFSHGLPDKDGKPTVSEKIFIKKGERALHIWKPYDVKYTVMPDGSEKRSAWLTKSEREQAKIEKWKELTRKYFILVPVFDITQTTASPDVYPKLCGLGGVKGTSADARFNALKNYCENVLNCPVKVRDFGERKATVRGSFYPDLNEIHISDMLEGENKLSTFIHELGHATLHADSYKNASKSTAQIELEADMYALMIERRLGIEPTDARCRHLKAHYDEYLTQTKATDINADTELFNNVINRYREQIPLIDAYVDNLNVAEAQTNKSLSHRPSNAERVAPLNEIKIFDSAKEYIDQNIKDLAKMTSVYDIDASKLEKTGRKPSDIFAEYFKEWGNHLYSKELGDIAVEKSSVRSEIRHGITAEKIASIEAIPEVIDKGKVIFVAQKSESGLQRIVVGAPIKIGDTPYYMGVMLQRDIQTQRLYLHNVAIAKEAPDISQDILLTTGSHEKKENLFITSILQNALIVKYQNDPSVKEDTQQEKAKNNIENLGRKNGESKPSRL